MHALAGRLLVRRKNRRLHNHWSPWQRAKYYLLAGMLVMAVFGSHWLMIFDPLVLLYRTTATALLPAAQWAVEEGSTTVYQSDPGVGPLRLAKATEPVYRWLHENVFLVPKQAFLGGGAILAFFLVMLLLNWYRPRFWCRYVCPLGAMLGFCHGGRSGGDPSSRRIATAAIFAACRAPARPRPGPANIGSRRNVSAA